MQACPAWTGSPGKPAQERKIEEAAGLLGLPCSPTSLLPSFPGPAPVKANAFQGNSGSSSHLAGPQRLYLESGRGRGQAHWRSQPELASRQGTAMEKPKDPHSAQSPVFPVSDPLPPAS